MSVTVIAVSTVSHPSKHHAYPNPSSSWLLLDENGSSAAKFQEVLVQYAMLVQHAELVHQYVLVLTLVDTIA